MLVNEIPKRDEFHPELSLVEGIELRESKINFLQEKIKNYLIRISREEISGKQSIEVYSMIAIVKDMESIGDLIHRSMLPLMEKKKTLGSDFSEEGKEELMIYHAKAGRQLSRLRDALAERVEHVHQLRYARVAGTQFFQGQVADVDAVDLVIVVERDLAAAHQVQVGFDHVRALVEREAEGLHGVLGRVR